MWLFGAQSLAYDMEIYGGILVFSGYILFDTQVRLSACLCPQQPPYPPSDSALLHVRSCAV